MLKIEVSTQAHRAEKHLAARGVEMTKSDILELIAAMHGFRNYQTMKPTLEHSAKGSSADNIEYALVAGGDSGNDFVMPPQFVNTWITVDCFAVNLVRTDEGIVVDIMDNSDSLTEIASTYAFTQEAVDEMVEEARVTPGGNTEKRVLDLCASTGIKAVQAADGRWELRVHAKDGSVEHTLVELYDSETAALVSGFQEFYAKQVRKYTAVSCR